MLMYSPVPGPASELTLYTRDSYWLVKMAVESQSQSQAPLRYMAVPEKIELGGGRGTRDPSGGGGRYRPMKVLQDSTGDILYFKVCVLL